MSSDVFCSLKIDSPRREFIIVSAVIVSIMGFYLLTMRPGHRWGGDAFQYISHARNIAEGRKYSDTGYIFNPYAPLAPQTYPPVLPLFLTLPYRFFGLNLEAMKYFMLFPVGGFLVAFYVWVRRRISPSAAIWLLLVMGMNPFLWAFKENILSDVPFLAFLCLTFFLVDKLEDKLEEGAWNRTETIFLSVAVGGSIYLCFGTRAVGLVLLPALIAYDLLRFRRVRFSSLMIVAVASSLVLVQNRLLETLNHYNTMAGGAAFLHNFPLGLVRNIEHNLISVLFLPSISEFGRGGLRLVVVGGGVLVLLGLASTWSVLFLKRQMAVYDVFGVLYLGMIAILPFGLFRYYMPLVPLFLVYLAHALQTSSFLGNLRALQLLFFPTVALLSISATIFYATSVRSSLRNGVHAVPAVELFEYVREEVPEDAVCVFSKPRVLALFTGRPAAKYNDAADLDLMLEFFRKIEARYLIARRSAAEDDPLRHFIAAYGDQLSQVFENNDFAVYRTLFSTDINLSE